MDAGQGFMMLLMLGAGAGYYWFKIGRHGGMAGTLKHMMGLREGEQLASQWNAFFDFDQSTSDQVVDAVFSQHTRGKHLYVGLTNQGRLVIAQQESKQPPMSFERHQVAITPYSGKAKVGQLAGMSGMESAKVVQVTPSSGDGFRLQIASSAAQALQSWSAGA